MKIIEYGKANERPYQLKTSLRLINPREVLLLYLLFIAFSD